MSRRGKIRVLSYALALFISLFTALAACHIGAGGYTVQLDAQSTRSFGEALSAVERLDQSLKKCAFASGSSMESTICAQIYSDAQCTETALSALPVQLDALDDISKQISVMGDYAFTISRCALEGVCFSDEELSQLASFSRFTSDLHEQLGLIQQSFEDGTMIFEPRLRLMDSLDNLKEESSEKIETLDHAFHRLRGNISDSSSMIYDGQYSEKSSNYLDGYDPVSQSEALDKAAAFLNSEAEDLEPLDSSEGDIPGFRFSVRNGEGVIAVTVHGGHVIRYLSDQEKGASIDRETAFNVCKSFLESHGYTNMVESTDALDLPGGAFCFVPVQDGVICAMDRIVLRVSQENGQITAFDATDYLIHHHDRQLSDINRDSLQSALPETLAVQDSKTVLLLTPGGAECLCAEYHCKTSDGISAIIDVNAETGRQQRILLEGETVGIIH